MVVKKEEKRSLVLWCGPVEPELNTYGHNGEVVGLVMGDGEFSSSVALLADFIARKKAEEERRQLCFVHVSQLSL
jgi:hypothetical protein